MKIMKFKESVLFESRAACEGFIDALELDTEPKLDPVYGYWYVDVK